MSKNKSHPEHIDATVATSEDVAVEHAVTENEEEVVTDSEDRLANLTPEQMMFECTEAQQRADENWEKLLRVQAEMENVRRRAERDVASAHKYGLERFIKSLLPVVDSLERGMDIVVEGSAEVRAMHEGMQLTHKLLLETLGKQGIKQLNPLGESFNPEQMEAVSMQPASEADPNTVLSVVQKGYLLNDRLVRPVMVVVSQ